MIVSQTQRANVACVSEDHPAFAGIGVSWFVIRTRSRQEKALALDLAAKSIVFFLPLVNAVRYYGRRKVRTNMPLFPGYVFVAGHRDDCFEADRTGRVAQILEVSDQQRLREELQRIARVLQSGRTVEPCNPLVRGTEVEVSSGPFKGLRGMVDSKAHDNRLVLHVDLIGKAAFLEIESELLRTVS